MGAVVAAQYILTDLTPPQAISEMKPLLLFEGSLIATFGKVAFALIEARKQIPLRPHRGGPSEASQ